MLTVALGLMLCLPLRFINYSGWALMGNDSQQYKPPCFSRLQWGIGDTCGTLWITGLRFQITKNLCDFNICLCFVYCFFYLILQLWFQNTDVTSTAGYDSIIQHLNDGKRTCKEIEDFMKARWEATVITTYCSLTLLPLTLDVLTFG